MTTSPPGEGPRERRHDFDVRPDGRIALAGADESRLWVATMDTNGQIEDQVTLVSEFDSSIAYDVAWTPEGDIAVAGTTNDGPGWSRFVRLYSDTFVEQWTNDGPANGDFSMAITADAHGHIVAASTENCDFNGVSRYESCRQLRRRGHKRPLGGGDTRSEWWAEQHHP